MARKGTGRKKIQIKKIENQSNLEVTFSKRRSGIYKKASELSILCGCHVAIIIISAMNKIYSFGHPSAEHVIDSFINRNPEQYSMVRRLMESHRDHEFRELNEEIVDNDAIIVAEKTLQKAMNDELQNDPRDENCIKNWWSTPVLEELTLAEAEEMVTKIEEFKHFIDFSGMQTDSSSSLNGQWLNRCTNGISLDVPPRSGFSDGEAFAPADPHLASISCSCVRPSEKGKAPTWD